MVIAGGRLLEWSVFLGVSVILASRFSSQSSRTKTQAPGCLPVPACRSHASTAHYQSTFMIAASASWIKAFSVIAHFILHHLSFTTVHRLHLKTGFEFFPVAQL